jgi:hypothetical protein
MAAATPGNHESVMGFWKLRKSSADLHHVVGKAVGSVWRFWLLDHQLTQTMWLEGLWKL